MASKFHEYIDDRTEKEIIEKYQREKREADEKLREAERQKIIQEKFVLISLCVCSSVPSIPSRACQLYRDISIADPESLPCTPCVGFYRPNE